MIVCFDYESFHVYLMESIESGKNRLILIWAQNLIL